MLEDLMLSHANGPGKTPNAAVCDTATLPQKLRDIHNTCVAGPFHVRGPCSSIPDRPNHFGSLSRVAGPNGTRQGFNSAFAM